jgi:hypothetical protein
MSVLVGLQLAGTPAPRVAFKLLPVPASDVLQWHTRTICDSLQDD